MIDSKRGGWCRAVAAFSLLVLAQPAAADVLNARYSVSLMGIHVGELYADGTMAPQSYRMSLKAHLSGIATLLSNMQLALSSSGSVRKGSFLPSAYATNSVNSSETRTLRMALNAGNVKALEITPPPRFYGERVPLTNADQRNVLDPTSALLMPVPMKSPLTGPAACERTLPIYDGYARFDIALHYVGTQDVSVQGYSGPVSVCSARYRPIAGHIVDSKSTAFMAANDKIQVWLAPIEHAHVVVPLRVTLPTVAGNLDVEATEFNTTTDAAATH